MLIGTLCDWRNSKGIRCCANMSPKTARSIASERINPPSKNVDKIETAPLISLSTFVAGPKYTPLPQSTNHAFFFPLWVLAVSENGEYRKLGEHRWLPVLCRGVRSGRT